LILLVVASCLFVASAAASSSYRAAVVEYVPAIVSNTETYTRADALTLMKENIEAMGLYLNQAAADGVQILVWPEYGLTGYPTSDWTRDSILPFLDVVPDPSNYSGPINPCRTPELFPGAELTIQVSCLAQDFGIHVVVDLGDVQPCPGLYAGSTCSNRTDARAQYNTALAFLPDGTLVTKYHKHHLYGEGDFMDTDQTVMPANFTTTFGVDFGLFICFDIIFSAFESPLLQHFAFPTFWDNSWPGLNATQFQKFWSRLHNVNLLAANVGDGSSSSGSGIWNAGHPLAEWNNNSPIPLNKYLYADVPI